MSLGGLILLSLALGVAAWLFFLWTVKSGQYEDPEGPKYRMLDDEEPGERERGGRGPRDAGEGDSPPRWTRAERSESEQAPAGGEGQHPSQGSAGGEGRHAS
jgi:cbb3-type cytochrome oxidase maturation protein